MLLPLVFFEDLNLRPGWLNKLIGPAISLLIQAAMLITNIVAAALSINAYPDAEIAGS